MMDIGGIFGPKKSGKTTLARHLSRKFWITQRMRTLVYDINQDFIWGNQAWNTNDEKKFWQAVWKLERCVVIVDEAAATIKRDRDLIPAFTRIRHQHHIFIVIGHSGTDLLPVMRDQIDAIFLFRQNKKASQLWADTMTEDGLLAAATLNQYEFIFHRMYSKPQKLKLDATLI